MGLAAQGRRGLEAVGEVCLVLENVEVSASERVSSRQHEPLYV